MTRQPEDIVAGRAADPGVRHGVYQGAYPGADQGAPGRPGGLEELVEGCVTSGVHRAALLVSVPALPTALRRAHHLRLIEAALKSLEGLDRAAMFRLADASLVMTWRGPAPEALERTCAELDTLFGDLTERPYSVLSLPDDADRLTRAIEASQPEPVEEPARKLRQLNLESLATLEAALTHADAALLSRRSPVCAWTEDGLRAEWDWRRMDVRDVTASLAPDYDLTAEPYLFRRLARVFDRRLLTLLSYPFELRGSGPFAIDLALPSVLEPAFLRFDAALPAALRGQVMVNLTLDEVTQDPASFAFARDFLRARAYRVGLRGVRLDWVAVFPPSLSGVDRVHVDVSDLRGEQLAGGSWPALAPEVTARMVLGGVAHASVLDWGVGQGIALFEGPAARPDPALLRRLNLHRQPRADYPARADFARGDQVTRARLP